MPPLAPRAFRSATVYEGTIRATARSVLHARGQGDEDIARPHVGVFHTGGEISPCKLNLRDQARHAKTGIDARAEARAISVELDAAEISRRLAPRAVSTGSALGGLLEKYALTVRPRHQGAVTHSGAARWLRDAC